MGTETLQYAGPAARYGVTWERTPDGVRIVVPQSFRHCFAAANSGLELIAMPIVWLVLRSLGKLKPRAVIELNATEFRLEESRGAEAITTSFPRDEIAELRANRYGPGLYLRIPGKTNIDLLTNVDSPLVKWIGETLESALKDASVAVSK